MDSLTNMKKFAVWAITPNGAKLAHMIADELPSTAVLLSAKQAVDESRAIPFNSLAEAIGEHFDRFAGHVFIMSTGIVVRLIAPHLQHKTKDPAVVVTDEKGRHAISLVSGHVGGANRLARLVADAIGGEPVITTATDVNRLPAIDLLAKDKGLVIENPEAIKHANMAILLGDPIRYHDPFGFLPNDDGAMAEINWQPWDATETDTGAEPPPPGVYIDDRQIANLPGNILVLRPPTLAAGIGCNRGTPMEEIHDLLMTVLAQFGLAAASVKTIASVDLKQDEVGLLALARRLKRRLTFYSREQLGRVTTIQNPSVMVEKHIGVKSVCEAAAILATKGGTLIVPKHNTRNVTVALARVNQANNSTS